MSYASTKHGSRKDRNYSPSWAKNQHNTFVDYFPLSTFPCLVRSFDLLNKEILGLTRFGIDTPGSVTITFSNLRRLTYLFDQFQDCGGFRKQLATRDEKTDLPNVKGEVKRAIKATFAHLCTTLTRDKCLHLPAVKGAPSGDKGRFCHAFNPYL